MAYAQKATVNWSLYREDILEYLENEAPENWRAIFRPLIRGLVVDQGKRLALFFGLIFNIDPLFARAWYSDYISKMPIPIIDTTVKEVGKLIDDALTGGWSIPDMQKAIEDLFDIMEPYRSERIARTEVIRASNAGSVDLYQEWGVKRHEWLSSQDSRTRGNDPKDEFDHVAMHGVVVDIGTPFMVPGQDGDEALMFPGDPAGSAGNTIECRCTTLPIVEGMTE